MNEIDGRIGLGTLDFDSADPRRRTSALEVDLWRVEAVFGDDVRRVLVATFAPVFEAPFIGPPARRFAVAMTSLLLIRRTRTPRQPI